MGARLDVPRWGWAAFVALVLALLAVDLAAHRGARVESRRAAGAWSLFWIGLGLAFCVFVWIVFGVTAAEEYLGAYLIEKALSLDNMFVFLVIFRTLGIDAEAQRRGLLWGIVGALAFRGIFVGLGAAALERWASVRYLFSAILLVAAIHVWREDPARRAEGSRLVEWLRRRLPVAGASPDKRFFVVEDGRRRATPLFLAVIAIELTDVVFAIDSVPAAFSISRDPFIVYSSNVFAILGLRALYLVLVTTIGTLRYLHHGLAGVLAFAAVKMGVPEEWLHIPPLISVGVIVVLIGASVAASLASGRRSGRVGTTRFPPV